MYFHMYAYALALTVRHTRRFIGKTDVSFDSSYFYKNQTSKCNTSVILVCFVLLMNVFCDTAGSVWRETQTQISVDTVKQPFLFLRVHSIAIQLCSSCIGDDSFDLTEREFLKVSRTYMMIPC